MMKNFSKSLAILVMSLMGLSLWAADGPSVVPEHFLRGFDPITIFFDSNVGPRGGGPADDPGTHFRLSPDHPGEYRWLDEKTLQFLPTVAWPALRRYRIKSGSTEVVLTTMMVPPERIRPSNGSANLEPVKQVELSFDSYLAAADLAEMLSFEVKALPGVGEGGSSWLSAKDFAIKVLDRTAERDPYKYLVLFNRPIEYGRHVTVHLKLSLDANIKGSAAKYVFSTKPEFRLAGMGCNYTKLPVTTNGSIYTVEQAIDCGSSTTPLYLEFSEELASLSIERVKRLVRFEPAVKNLSYKVSGKRLYLYFSVDRETPYKLTVDREIINSRSGRPLLYGGKSSFYFYYKKLSPYLYWKRSEAMMERYGAQFFPMEGRALDRVDLRIYPIDPLSKNFWPYPSSPVVVDERKAPLMPGEEPEYGTNMREQIKLLGSPLISEVVELPIDENGVQARFGLNLKDHLARISGQDQPGSYLVGYRLLGSSSKRQYVRVTVTDLALTAVEEEHAVNFVVTSLNTARPVRGAKVEVEAWVTVRRERVYKTVISGVTGSDGQFRYEHKRDLGDSLTVERVIITHEKDVLVIDPDNPPPMFSNHHWYGSSSTWLNWVGSDPRREKAKPRYRGYVVTERPIYKPEEEVHILGFYRVRQQGEIKEYPQGRGCYIMVYGPGGKKWKYPVSPDNNGKVYLKFEEKDLPTGQYRVTLSSTDDGQLSSTTFRKEAYRVPRFEIKISGPDRVPLDSPFELLLTADYYAGGRVVGQDVSWSVTQYEHRINIPAYPGYIFSTDESYSGYNDYYDSTGTTRKRDVTDENGSARLTIDPSLERDGKPKRYVVEATVRGADSQTVSAVKTVVALPAFTLGLKMERFIKDKMEINPQVLAIGHDEKPKAGVNFKLRLYQRQWHSYLAESDFTTGEARYVTDVVDNLVFENDYLSQGQPLELKLPVEEAGVYVVELLARDKMGRLQTVKSDLYVAGDTPVTWKKTQANIFETSLNQRSYVSGDRAEMLLKSPFQSARALVIVEGATKNEYHWVDIKNGQGIFTLPIKNSMAPGIPVHTVIMRGRLPGTADRINGRVDRGKPISMANTTWLKIEPQDNRLNLKLEHKKVNLPGSTMEMTLRMTDPDGRPLDGEVALWLVDRAVLALGKEKPLNPLAAFIDQVKALLRLRETRNEVVGNLPVEEIAGGGGYDEEEMRASLFDEKTTVRRNFKTVPYYNYKIKVKNGVATIKIDLPDNLTDFAVRAIGTAGFSRFGTARSVVSVRLPLIIQSALPRFVRPGDIFDAGGIGRVVEGEGGPGRVELQVEGLTLQDGKDTKQRRLQWEKGVAQQLYFPLLAPDSLAYVEDKEVTVRMAVIRDSDDVRDAFEVKLPIAGELEERELNSYHNLESGQTYKFPEPDEKVLTGSVKQTMLVSDEGSVIPLIAGMNYMLNYEHACTEQRISKLYPTVALKGILKKAGLEKDFTATDEAMQDFFTYLEGVQKSNGIYSFWPGSDGYISLTAYVVEFLVLAKKSGYKFKPELLSRSIKVLKEALRSDYRGFVSGWSFTERAEALAALAIAGHYDDHYAQDLIYEATTKDLYSRAKILSIFIDRGKIDNPRVQRLLNSLWDSTVFKLQDDREVFGGLQYVNRRWGGLVLSSRVKTLAAVTRALYKADPSNPRVRLMVEEIVRLGNEDGWGNTNDNVAALMALSEVLDYSPRAKAHSFELRFGSEKDSFKTNGKVAAIYSRMSEAKGTLVKTAGEDSKPYCWLKVNYISDTPGYAIESRNEGFLVEEKLLKIGEDGGTVERYTNSAGESVTYEMDRVVEAHVRVINADDRKFVAISVPFAAGFEILNPNLATAPKEATPNGRITRQPDYAYYGDDRVTFYYDQLPKGTYHFYFRLRASFTGKFTQPPARAELMYDLKVKGRSDGTRVIIKTKEEAGE